MILSLLLQLLLINSARGTRVEIPVGHYRDTTDSTRALRLRVGIDEGFLSFLPPFLDGRSAHYFAYFRKIESWWSLVNVGYPSPRMREKTKQTEKKNQKIKEKAAIHVECVHFSQ